MAVVTVDSLDAVVGAARAVGRWTGPASPGPSLPGLVVRGRLYRGRMLLDTLLPVRCPACGRSGPAPCGACVGRMLRARPGPTPPALDACRSLLAYEGPARELVARLKYRNDRAALAWLADGMAGLVDPPAGAVVTWAPTTTRRRRDRGFDQAELLAAAVARRWGRPWVRLLVRRPGPPQTGRTVADRRLGPAMTATSDAAAWLGGRSVVVVDDVVTTGSTIAAAARVLRSVGAPWVAGLTAARTPRR